MFYKCLWHLAIVLRHLYRDWSCLPRSWLRPPYVCTASIIRSSCCAAVPHTEKFRHYSRLSNKQLYFIDCRGGKRHCSTACFSDCRFLFISAVPHPLSLYFSFFVPSKILSTPSSFDVVSWIWKMRDETIVVCFKVLPQYGVTEKDPRWGFLQIMFLDQDSHLEPTEFGWRAQTAPVL